MFNEPIKSLIYSLTISLGSNAFAGFISTILQFVETILYFIRKRDENKDKKMNFIERILLYVPLLFIKLLRKIDEKLSKKALIYVGVYNISYLSACKQWSQKRLCTIFNINSCSNIARNSLYINFIIFVLLSLILSYFICFNSDKYCEFSHIVSIITVLFTSSIFILVLNSIRTIFDCLMICYIDYPKILKRKIPNLKENIELLR